MSTPTVETTDANAWITKPSQVRALISPARQEIVDALEVAGPLTIAEVAGLIGRKSDALYFHAKRLVKVGLIRELEPRRNGRHVASLYDLAWRPMRLSYQAPVQAKDLAAVVAAAMRLAIRDFAAATKAYAKAAGTGVGRPTEIWGARVKGWLAPEEVSEVSQLLARAAAIVRSGRPREGARAMSVSFVLSPAAGRRGRPKKGMP